MRFQSLPKVCGADAGIDDCDENEDDGDGGKSRHRLSDWVILSHLFCGGMPYPNQFEEEIGKAGEI